MRINLLTCILAILLVFGGPDVGMAQVPQATITTTFNVLVTNVATKVIPFSATNAGWMIHPEDGGIRCNPGTSFGQAPIPPTSTTGVEFIQSGYFNNGTATPTASEWDCISESGSNVHVSGTIEQR